MRRRTRLVALVFVAAPLFAGCGASSSEDDATPVDPGASEADVVAAEWTRVEVDGVDTKGASLLARPGALFVRSASAFLRGKEDGSSFEPVAIGSLSERVEGGNVTTVRRAVAIDTHDANVMYRGTGATLEKSTDGGKTFAPLLDGSTLPEKNEGGLGTPPSKPKWIHDVAVSPADSKVLYVLLLGGTWGSSTSPNVWFMRSTDGGAAWSDVTAPEGEQRVVWAADRIEPHPTKSDAFFVLHPSMTGGRDTGRALYASDDGGKTYRSLGGAMGYFPQTVVGSGDALYSVHQADGRMQNAGVCVRDAADASGADRSCLPSTRFSGITVAGNTIYLAVTEGDFGKILASSDGARTWTETTRRAFPKVSSLAADASGKNVFAATENGLYRFAR